MEKYKSSDNVSYCLGSSLVIEALLHIPEYIERIYISPKYNFDDNEKLISLSKFHNIELVYDQKNINKLSLKDNCYAIAIFKKYYNTLKTNKHILLYDFNSYGDLGTIMRSAVSFDFKDIVIIGNKIDYFNPICVRASMGSLFQLNIEYYNTIDEYNNKYNNQIIYPFISNGKDFTKLKLINNYSLLIPNEFDALDNLYTDGYNILNGQIALSSLSAIVFSHCYKN